MNTKHADEAKDSFEKRLIAHLATLPEIENDYDKLAATLSDRTGKNVNGRSITFMARVENYAKKWQITEMMAWALTTGWMPSDMKDWEYLIWTITGKRQSAMGGDNSAIYRKLADIADKPEQLFESNYQQLLGGQYG